VDDAVHFTTGQVVSIQRVRVRRVKRDDAYGVIRVILRPPDLPYLGFTALLKHAPTLKLRDRNAQGSRFEMKYFEEPGEEEIRKVIRALKANRHLTRHQELEAYVAFEIPYSPGVAG
jgi:hypothetical protein